eukprot:COSAG01_NODE_787_length_13598_cov_17.218535_5_plen_52_part_00
MVQLAACLLTSVESLPSPPCSPDPPIFFENGTDDGLAVEIKKCEQESMYSA